MSKFKDKLLRDQDEYFDYMVSYEEWLDENLKELSCSELDELEEDLIKNPLPYKINKSLSELSLHEYKYIGGN